MDNSKITKAKIINLDLTTALLIGSSKVTEEKERMKRYG
jgi:hypothetical protein